MSLNHAQLGTLLLATFFAVALTSSASAQMQPVSSLTDAGQKLKSAAVEDARGQTIGHIQSVESVGGAPLNAKVALKSVGGTTKLVTIAASDLRYDATKNVVVTELPQSELGAMRQ